MSHQDPDQQYPGTGWNPPVSDPYAPTADASGSPLTGEAARLRAACLRPVADVRPARSGLRGARARRVGLRDVSGVRRPGLRHPGVRSSRLRSSRLRSAAYGAPAYAGPGYGFLGFGGALTYASWLQRVGAYLLDSLAVLPYLAGLLVMTVTSEPGVNRYGDPVDQPTSAGALAFGIGALATLVLWGWNRWVRGGRTGQSWGKKVVGLTMQGDATRAPIGVWMAFVRDLAHYVDGFFYLGYLWPLWDGKRQTFSDKLTKTVVVQ